MSDALRSALARALDEDREREQAAQEAERAKRYARDLKEEEDLRHRQLVALETLARAFVGIEQVLQQIRLELANGALRR